MDLQSIGWTRRLSLEFDRLAHPDWTPARVCSGDRRIFTVISDQGELAAEVSGKFRAEARARSDFPAVGDWVALAPRWEEGTGTIHALLPRQGVLARRNSGPKTEEQIVAVNVDTVVIVSGLDHDFNPRRLERFLAIAWTSGASPVIVLNKADACADPAARVAEVQGLAPMVPVIATCATSGRGMEALPGLLVPGTTAVFVGSSGVGKSTLVNALLGAARQDTGPVRGDDSRGRHTTTRRDLFILPGGPILIDNPGMREVGLWGAEEGVSETFTDIETLADGCRFSDCRHLDEPGCAVRSAVEEGSLEEARYAGYLKLRRELAWVEMRDNEHARQEMKRRQRQLSRIQKSFRKDRK